MPITEGMGLNTRSRIVLFGGALLGPLATAPLLMVSPKLGILVAGAAVLVWLASKSVAIPVALAGVPDVIVGVKGSNPLPAKWTIYLTVGWTVVALLIALMGDAGAFPLSQLISGPVLVTFALVALMTARLGSSLVPSYGSYKLQLFIAKAVVSLFAGIFIAKRRKDFDLFLALFVVVSLASGLVLVNSIIKGTATSVDAGRLALFADANPIELGRWAALGLLFGVFLILSNGPAWRRVIALVATPILAVALLAAGSRGPTLGLVVGGLVLVALVARNAAIRKRLVLIAGAGLAAALIVPALVPGHALSRSLSVILGGGTSAQGGLDSNGRFQLFSEAWHAFASHPLLGIGTGSFPGLQGDIYPHNIVLEAAAEYGLLGLVFVVAFLVLVIRAPLRVFRQQTGDARTRAAFVLALLSMSIVNAMVSGSLENVGVLWLAAGFGIGVGESLEPASGRLGFRRRGKSPVLPTPPPGPAHQAPGRRTARSINGAVTSPPPGAMLGGRVRVEAVAAETGWNVESLHVECSFDGRAWIEIGPAEGDDAYDVYLVSRGVTARRRHVGLVRSRERAEQLRSTLEAEHRGGPERVEVASAQRGSWSGDESHGALWDTTEHGDGQWRLRAVTVDVAGRRVSSPEISVTLDNTPPVVGIEAPVDEAVLLGPVEVKVSARDASSGVASLRLEYSLGEEWVEIRTVSSAPYEAAWDPTGLEEGHYRLRAVALDEAGNESTSKAVTVRVERVDPAIRLAEVPATLTGRAELRVTLREGFVPDWVEFQAAPAESFEWRALARVEQPPYGIALETDSLPDGPYDLRAIVGKNGHVDASRPARGVKVDNTAPWIVLSEPKQGAWLREEIVLTANASDEGSGLKSILFQFSPDGQTWRPVVSTHVPSGPGSALWEPDGLEDGRYLLRAVAADQVGNLGASEPVAVQLDRTPPEVDLRLPEVGAELSGIVTLEAHARDEGSGVIGVRFECSEDAETWSELASMTVPPYNTAWDTRELADGPYKLRCVARDRVGNTTFGVPFDVRVANNPVAPVAPPVVIAPAPVPAPPQPILDVTPRAVEGATLWQLERLARENADDPRHDEREALLYSLRSVARPDGTIPDGFWPLVWETFGDLFKP